MTNPSSGDLCSFGRSPNPVHYVTHYRCDDYPDGTVVDARNGKIIERAPAGAKIGFNREDKA